MGQHKKNPFFIVLDGADVTYLNLPALINRRSAATRGSQEIGKRVFFQPKHESYQEKAIALLESKGFECHEAPKHTRIEGNKISHFVKLPDNLRLKDYELSPNATDEVKKKRLLSEQKVKTILVILSPGPLFLDAVLEISILEVRKD